MATKPTLRAILVVACSLGLPAGASRAATVAVATCQQAAVQAAVDAAASGDTIMVPAGACSWSAPVTVRKALTLKGAGSALTVVTTTLNAPYNTGLVQYLPTAAEATKTFELAGFSFNGNYTTGCFLAQAPSATTAITGLKIHDNRFLNGNSRAVVLSGLEFGTFYANQFQDNYIGVSVIGAEMNGWNYPVAQGGANYPFFEDNVFTQTVARGGFIVETGRGGRIVFRHNSVNNYGGAGGEVFDAHGVTGTYPVDTGTVSSEYYHNTISLMSSTRVFNHRGGKGVFANNTIIGSGYINTTEYQGWSYCTAAPYPKPQQVNASYYWSNSGISPRNFCTSGSCSSCAQYDSTYIVENRDFWQPASGAESALPKTCAANALYATTDTDVVYKCGAANNWSAIFRPYTYPHPLRGATIIPPGNIHVIP